MGGKWTEGPKGREGRGLGAAFWSRESLVWSLAGAGGEAGAGHALAEATLSEEILFQAAELLVKKVAGHLDQADDDVGTDGGFRVLDAFFESFVICPRHTVELAQAAEIGRAHV